MTDRNTCPDCGRPVASPADWRRAEANDAAGGDPEAPWAVALCWGEGNNCDPATAADRIAALEAAVERLRRERERDRGRIRTAALLAIRDGSDLARLVERARPHLGDVDRALLAWANGAVVLRAEAGL